jgi:hypothetical protein
MAAVPLMSSLKTASTIPLSAALDHGSPSKHGLRRKGNFRKWPFTSDL